MVLIVQCLGVTSLKYQRDLWHVRQGTFFSERICDFFYSADVLVLEGDKQLHGELQITCAEKHTET